MISLTEKNFQSSKMVICQGIQEEFENQYLIIFKTDTCIPLEIFSSDF